MSMMAWRFVVDGDAVDEPEVDHVDAELGVDDVAQRLLDVGDLRGAHWGWAVGLGSSLYLVFFFEPLPLVMGLTFAALAALALYQRRLDWVGLLKLVSLTLAAFAGAYLGTKLLFGYDLFVNMAEVLADATDFNERAHRPYDVWVVRDLGDFALCAGFAAIVLIGYAGWDAVRRGVPARSPR